MLLVMQPSTGEMLAVAQNAAANAQGTPALTGQYPPGSTFKVVTATAALERGLTAPGQPIDCPGVFDRAGPGRSATRTSLALGTVDVTRGVRPVLQHHVRQPVRPRCRPTRCRRPAAAYGVGLDFVMTGVTT